MRWPVQIRAGVKSAPILEGRFVRVDKRPAPNFDVGGRPLDGDNFDRVDLKAEPFNDVRERGEVEAEENEITLHTCSATGEMGGIILRVLAASSFVPAKVQASSWSMLSVSKAVVIVGKP